VRRHAHAKVEAAAACQGARYIRAVRQVAGQNLGTGCAERVCTLVFAMHESADR
jgi:hypothetical protein